MLRQPTSQTQFWAMHLIRSGDRITLLRVMSSSAWRAAMVSEHISTSFRPSMAPRDMSSFQDQNVHQWLWTDDFMSWLVLVCIVTIVLSYIPLMVSALHRLMVTVLWQSLIAPSLAT